VHRATHQRQSVMDEFAELAAATVDLEGVDD
jgi:hypothetical protein